MPASLVHLMLAKSVFMAMKAGLALMPMGDLNTAGNVQLTSKGDLFYRNVQSGGVGTITADGGVRQYGDAKFTGDVNVSAGSFTLYSDRKLETDGNVSISTDDFVVVVGEIAAEDINITTTASVTNNGFVLANGQLRVVAGDDVLNEREIATEYDGLLRPYYRAISGSL